jgi:DNA-binding transcriptional regulator YhcF (GntR family)
MILTLNMASEVPIYQQIYDGIVLGIASGKLLEGEALPSVRQLAVEIGVNIHTVNKAYNLLRQDGFIQMRRREGAVVCPDKAPTAADVDRISALLLSAAAQAKSKNMGTDNFLRRCAELYDRLERGDD